MRSIIELPTAEMIEICQTLDTDGHIEFISVIAGSSSAPDGWVHVFPPMAIAPVFVADDAAALSVHIGWFFQEDSPGPAAERAFVVRQQNRRRLTCSKLSGTEYLGLHDYLLSANLNGDLALGISRYEPGASTGDDSYGHDGEEAGLVLSGRLELTIDQQVHVLEAGNSFSFTSHRQHRYANPSATDETVVVWANTPITLRK